MDAVWDLSASAHVIPWRAVGCFVRSVGGNGGRIPKAGQQHLSMLQILYAASAAALDAFRAADNPVDAELVEDLERMVERTRLEIQRLAAHLGERSS